MNIADALAAERTYESENTRKLLERVPEAHWKYTPHEKSMDMGVLASHIAEIPTWVGHTLDLEEMKLNMEEYVPFHAAGQAELLKAFDANIDAAIKSLAGRDDDHMLAPWRMKVGGQVVFEMPRLGVIRSMILSHTAHHRGQLEVYLRIHDVPIPSIYGPSADEQGF